MTRQFCVGAIAVVLALVAVAHAPIAVANPDAVVRVESNSGDFFVSGVAVGPDVVVAPAGAISDNSAVTIHRGANSGQATARVVQGLAIIRIDSGGAASAPLAHADSAAQTALDVISATRSGVDRASSLLINENNVYGLSSAAPVGGGAAFNGCGELAALVTADGSIIQASVIANTLRAANVTAQRGSATCQTPADGGVSELRDKVAELQQRLAAARTERQRRELQTEIADLQVKIDTELAAQAEQRVLVEQAAQAERGERERERQLALRIGIGVAALVLVLIGVAVWLWLRSRKLDKNLADARKGGPVWNDCVLESEAGATVKLSGAKLAKGGVVIGRSREEADVVIDKDDVSRRHARFEALDGALHVSDLGSTNKTFVNGKDLERGLVKRLYEGDKISIGANEFIVRILKTRGD